jgi:hypothetical protein
MATKAEGAADNEDELRPTLVLNGMENYKTATEVTYDA